MRIASNICLPIEVSNDPMQLSPLIRKCRNNSHLILVSLIVLLACLSLGGLKPQPTQAQNFPNTPVTTNIMWQQGSFPVENFQAYTSPFGYRISPIDGKKEFHSGLDIAAPLGSYVRNWWTGQVVGLSDNTACGTSVTIKSGLWQHIYCHLSGHIETTPQGRYLSDRHGNIQLWQGQTVVAGTRIGRVGMTGRTTGPHLHWTLKYNKEYVDPALVIRQMYGNSSS